METSTFTVNGMTCEACVKMINEKVSALPDVKAVKVDLNKKSVEIQADKKVELTAVASALQTLPKYQVSVFPETKSPTTAATVNQDTFYKTYKPLIIIFAFILASSFAFQLKLGQFDLHMFKDHLMAGFFIGLSFFKFLDLKAFSESFSSYDPIAQKYQGYGTVYPFIELILGLLFVSGKFLLVANLTTIFVLSLTTYGVYLRLQSKSKFQCACLGTTFNLPLSNVTLAENVAMILMAASGLVGM